MAYALSNGIGRYLLREARPLSKFMSTAAKSPDKIAGANAGHEFRVMFGGKRMKKNWELIPLFAIIGGAVLGLGGYIVYASQSRDDVRYFSKANFETTDLLNPKKRKLVVFGQDYRPMNEIAVAYNAMEEKEQKEEKE